MEQPRTSSPGTRLSARDKLFGVCLGLAAVLIIARAKILQSDVWFTDKPIRDLLPLLPLAVYQDMAFCAALSWWSWVMLGALGAPSARRVISLIVWLICGFAAAYAFVNYLIIDVIGVSPVTYELIILSDHLRLIRGAAFYDATASRVVKIVSAPLMVGAIAWMLQKLAPGLLQRTARMFHSPACAIFLLLYLLAGKLWVTAYPEYYPIFCNPEWRFGESFFDWSAPFVDAKFPKRYADDFLPVGSRHGLPVSAEAGTKARSLRSPNVVMVVMESVGARYLGIYGAPFADTPELARMAAHAAVFDNVYVGQAMSNNAIGGLLCSIYPYLGWQLIATRAPRLAIDSLATVLAAHGYRTALMHGGDFYTAKSFLTNHGFGELYEHPSLHNFMGEKPDDAGGPEDPILTQAALKWIDADHSRPFFLLLWTLDTHYPYDVPPQHDFGIAQLDSYKYLKNTPGAANLNRYLNAIEETDAIIAQIMRGLEARGLADDTIVVVTGDHGEQFRQHGSMGHGVSVYEDEVRVPLLIINRKLFPNQLRIESLGRQMDIAPTLLGLLEIEPPPQWQGQDLFVSHPERVYLYNNYDDINFGFVEGNLKYIYNLSKDRAEIYDLKRDPGERRNLAGDPLYASFASEAQARLAGWVGFQNHYLDQFIDRDTGRKATNLSAPAMPRVTGAKPETTNIQTKGLIP